MRTWHSFPDKSLDFSVLLDAVVSTGQKLLPPLTSADQDGQVGGHELLVGSVIKVGSSREAILVVKAGKWSLLHHC